MAEKKSTKTASKTNDKKTVTKKDTSKKVVTKKTTSTKTAPKKDASKKVEPIKKETPKKEVKEKNEINKSYSFKTLEVVVLVILTCVISLIVGSVITSAMLKKDTKITENSKELKEFIDNYKYIVENYDGQINKDDLISGAIKGMLEGLDQHSVFLGQESSTFDINLKGSYEGLGMEVTLNKDGKIYITNIIEDSPASETSLKVGDIISKIDNVDLTNKQTTDLSSYVHGSNKDDFTLTILRDGKKQKIKISKESITLKSVTSKVYEEKNHKIGYIKISVFALNTTEQFTRKLKELEDKNIDKLIEQQCINV